MRQGDLAITVSVPVAYSPEDVVKRIFREFLSEALESRGCSYSDTLANSSGRRDEQWMAGLGAILLGILLIPVSVLDVDLSVLQLTASLRIVFGLFLLVFSGFRSQDGSRDIGRLSWLWKRIPAGIQSRLLYRFSDDKVTRDLLRAAEYLNWTWEQSRDSGLSAGPFGVMVTSSNTYRTRKTERPIARSDVVMAFRKTIERYVRSTNQRVILCVDELDKIDNGGNAMALLNELKDLMKVPQTHFILSVSEDALRSFALRGVEIRDAVDSTFDEVLQVQPLDADEAREVIISRAPEFPVSLTRFCFAWSLGVPRDLLRAARYCIRGLNQDDQHEPDLGSVARAIVTEDVCDVLTAKLSKNGELHVPTKRNLEFLTLLDAKDIGGLFAFFSTQTEENDAQSQDNWSSVLDYLQFALEVLEVFGIGGLSYIEWRQRGQDGELTASAERIVESERMRRLFSK